MAITFKHAQGSPQGGSDGWHLTYYIFDSSPSGGSVLTAGPAVYAALLNEAPLTFNGWVRRAVNIRPSKTTTAQGIWEGTADYGDIGRPQTNSSDVSFQTSGGSQRVTRGISRVSAYGVGATVNDFDGGINVRQVGNGLAGYEPQGIDITAPVCTKSYNYFLPSAYITDRYQNNLFLLTGCVNNARFKGFDPGELLFMGANLNQRGSDDCQCQFNFSGSPNGHGLTVAGITGIDKRGWDYLWTFWIPDPTGLGAAVARVYVEQVYKYADFRLLGIGT
jgi:hypothetical protein